MYKYDLSKTTSVKETTSSLTSLTVLPNPVSSSAKISFQLDEQQQGKIELYDLSGKLVSTLYEGVFTKGENEFIWNPSENKNNVLSNGTYICRIISGKMIGTKKILLIR